MRNNNGLIFIEYILCAKCVTSIIAVLIAPKIISHILQVSKPRLRGYTVRNKGWYSNLAQDPLLNNCHPQPGKSWQRLGASNPCLQLHKRKAEKKNRPNSNSGSDQKSPNQDGEGAKPRDHT